MKKAFLTLICFIIWPSLAGASTLAATLNDGQHNGSFILGGVIPTVSFQVTGASSVSYTVSDENSKVVAGPTSVTVTGGTTPPISMPASKLGYYRVDAHLPDGTVLYPTGSTVGSRPPGFITYAVMNNPDLRFLYPSNLTRFGVQDQMGSPPPSSVLSYLGVRWVGYLGQEWSRLEPSGPNTFSGVLPVSTWNTTASVTPTNASWQTFTVFYFTADKNPPWSQLAGTCGINQIMCALNSTAVAELPSFASKYATAAKTQYPNQVRFYEITWEPGFPFGFGGTDAQLLQYFQLTYPAIHAADPAAVVMGPTLFPNSENTIIHLNGAGSPPFSSVADGISMHPYETNGWPPELNNGPYGHTFPSSPNNIVFPNLSFLKGLRDQQGIMTSAKGHAVPMIGTEQGYGSDDFSNIPNFSPTNRVQVDQGLLQQAQANVRQTIIFLGEGGNFDTLFKISDGVSNFAKGAYFNLGTTNIGPAALGPKPSAPSYSAMTWLLDGFDRAHPLRNAAMTGTQMGYKFVRTVHDPKAIKVVWDYATTSTANIGSGAPGVPYKIYDWMGNLTASGVSTGHVSMTLTGNPQYLVIH